MSWWLGLVIGLFGSTIQLKVVVTYKILFQKVSAFVGFILVLTT